MILATVCLQADRGHTGWRDCCGCVPCAGTQSMRG